MFETLSPTQNDSLLALIGAYRADPRAHKIDVGVGVYRDETGATPVMSAVKQAEARLLAGQVSKTYLGLVGSVEFNTAMVDQVLGELAAPLRERVRAVQTPGGCGALRAVLDLAALSQPDACVWLSDPTWLNHKALVQAARLKVRSYPYIEPATQALRFDDMVASLSQAGPGDVVLLHGCCHNPTGTDLTEAQWIMLTELALTRGFVPLIDLAYQGLGHGMDADAFGVRHMAARVPELLVAVSCSKNFALYRERVGCAMVFSHQPERLGVAFDQLLGLLRGNHSMPPDHGAAVVACILNDAELKANWSSELQGMCARLQGLRQSLVTHFRGGTGGGAFDFIGKQNGLFSMLGLTSAEVLQLRAEHAIYMPGDSRTNIAGLASNQVEQFVKAVLAVRGEREGDL